MNNFCFRNVVVVVKTFNRIVIKRLFRVIVGIRKICKQIIVTKYNISENGTENREHGTVKYL